MAELLESKSAQAIPSSYFQPTLRPINNLIGNHKIPRPDLFLQTAHRTESNYRPNTNTPQRRNICSGRYFVGGMLVEFTMAGEEGDGDVVVLEDVDRC